MRVVEMMYVNAIERWRNKYRLYEKGLLAPDEWQADIKANAPDLFNNQFGLAYWDEYPKGGDWLPQEMEELITESIPVRGGSQDFYARIQARLGRLDPALADLENWFDGYAALWLEPKVVDIPEIVRHYVTPIHLVDESGVGFISSNSELDSRYRQLLENPSENNYSGDALLMSETTILSEMSARVEADWMGLDKDRNPIGCFGRSYSVIQTGDGWKISGFSLRSCRASSEL
jgi:hypothetical protein